MSKDRKADPAGNKPTVAEARAAWEGHPSPSLNNVLDALHAGGFTGMSKSTLQRWQKSGWTALDEAQVKRGAKNARKEAEKAIAEEVVAQVTEKTLEEIRAQQKADAADEDAYLAKFADKSVAEVAEACTREQLLAMIALSRRIRLHANMIVGMTPKAAANIMVSLKEKSSNVTLVLPTDVPTAPEGPRVVEGKVIEHAAAAAAPTPLQAAIREFKSKELKVVR